MSDIALAVVSGHDSTSTEVHSLPEGRCDGSRTPPDVQYEIMRRHKAGRCLADICREVHCDPRTAKAVIENWGTAQHTLRLQAHRSQVVDSLILGMHEAAKRGKLDSILSLSDRLEITEAPKGQQTSVGVQVILHGGQAPSELSRAKVTETSEGLENQAGNSVSPTTHVMLTHNSLSDKDLTAGSVSHDHAEASANSASVPKQDTLTIQAQKCESPRAGDSL